VCERGRWEGFGRIDWEKGMVHICSYTCYIGARFSFHMNVRIVIRKVDPFSTISRVNTVHMQMQQACPHAMTTSSK
jgi:hypothetical protein